MVKINYNLVDAFKLIFAILIMFAHTASSLVKFPAYIDMFFSLYIFGVPFFFTCSSYFFFKGLFSEKKIIDLDYSKYKKFSKRILTMYGVWSLIYFAFVVFNWIKNGFSILDLLNYLHKSIVFSTYSTIWFLPALWIGVTITYFILKKYNLKAMIYLAIIAYIIGSILYSYSPLFESNLIFSKIAEYYSDIFYTSRNGFFNGFPYVALGALIAYNDKKIRYETLYGIISFILVIIEVFAIKFYIKGFGVDFAISLIPFTYFFFKFLIHVKLKDHVLYLYARNYSMLIFLAQRIFISAIPVLLSEELNTILTQNPYLGLLYVCIGVFIVSYSIIKYRSKYKWLNLLS